MSKALNFMKKLSALLLKTVYVGSLLVFSMWLLKLLYFSNAGEEKQAVSTEYSRNEEMIDRILKGTETIPRGHFHITDKNFYHLEPEPPLCLRCHGIYPHTKDKKYMSFLNLHVGFLACEVCHVHRDLKDNSHYFAWVDLETGEKSMKVKGGYGKYDARIVPFRKVKDRHERLDKLIDEKFRDFYSSLKETRYQVEHRDELLRIHEYNLSKKSVVCLDCHKEDGYLDLSALGFPISRINHLTSSEVSRMMGKYETFYIPRMLRFE